MLAYSIFLSYHNAVMCHSVGHKPSIRTTQELGDLVWHCGMLRPDMCRQFAIFGLRCFLSLDVKADRLPIFTPVDEPIRPSMTSLYA
jgi:hypothetical protein